MYQMESKSDPQKVGKNLNLLKDLTLDAVPSL